MTDSQLLVLSVAIVFPISVLIFQIGMVVGAINRLNDTLQSARSTMRSSDVSHLR
jgi:hypothetical protein